MKRKERGERWGEQKKNRERDNEGERGKGNERKEKGGEERWGWEREGVTDFHCKWSQYNDNLCQFKW